jgi:hypothetical protein
MGNNPVSPAPVAGAAPVPPAAPAPQPCPVPSDLQKMVDQLDAASKKQDLTDAKLQLAEIKQINVEVDKAEGAYKQEYDTLRIATADYQQYAQSRTQQIDQVVPASEKKIIDGIVTCVTDQVTYLNQQWINAQPAVTAAQTVLAGAKLDRQNTEQPYRDALDYKSNQRDLEALKAQSTKLMDAKNFRAAYFLVETEMADDLGIALLKPTDFNANLEKLALAYYAALDKERVAQTAYNQAVADVQAKLKAFTDADNGSRDNIIKQIVDQQFTPAAAAAATGAEGGPPGASAAAVPGSAAPGGPPVAPGGAVPPAAPPATHGG